jgi:hypothetical protein
MLCQEDVAQDLAFVALLTPVATPVTTMHCASIIFPMTSPLLLAAQARMGDGQAAGGAILAF